MGFVFSSCHACQNDSASVGIEVVQLFFHTSIDLTAVYTIVAEFLLPSSALTLRRTGPKVRPS